jgi:hypothetical protein
MKNLKKVLPIFLVLILALVGGCTGNSDDNGDINKFNGQEFPFILNEDIEITQAFLYDGEFPENGSFKVENDVFALKVVNNSSKDIQLVRIYVVTDLNEYFFEITTLPSKKAVTVLEKNAQSISKDEKILEIREKNKIFFENKLSLCKDEFEITQLDSVFNIKNISSNDISSDVYVYFKRVDSNGDYFGGITFRSNAGGLKAGEFKQISAPHFIKENSEVLFVDYAKP